MSLQVSDLKVSEIEDKIDELLDFNPNGPFTHNIIGLYLSEIAKRTGVNIEANRIIREYDLAEKYGFVETEDIKEYCYYCQKDTITVERVGGDCYVCGFSKVTPKNLRREDGK